MLSDTSCFTSPASQMRAHDLFDTQDICENGRSVLRSSPSLRTALHAKNQEQEVRQDHVVKSYNLTSSHFQRRGQLEARLVELQKDVASFKLKLQFGGNRTTSLDVYGAVIESKESEEALESCPARLFWMSFGSYNALILCI